MILHSNTLPPGEWTIVSPSAKRVAFHEELVKDVVVRTSRYEDGTVVEFNFESDGKMSSVYCNKTILVDLPKRTLRFDTTTEEPATPPGKEHATFPRPPGATLVDFTTRQVGDDYHVSVRYSDGTELQAVMRESGEATVSSNNQAALMAMAASKTST